ncbi:hypothetical protein VTL71DRAFT_3785 [Oculimacula yallundae]|uniref:Uncharacterized protein n=1 Tax=Oculimacula yallundae TaxID=86028 RepID=A0ABR4C4N9_9HELO
MRDRQETDPSVSKSVGGSLRQRATYTHPNLVQELKQISISKAVPRRSSRSLSGSTVLFRKTFTSRGQSQGSQKDRSTLTPEMAEDVDTLPEPCEATPGKISTHLAMSSVIPDLQDSKDVHDGPVNSILELLNVPETSIQLGTMMRQPIDSNHQPLFPPSTIPSETGPGFSYSSTNTASGIVSQAVGKPDIPMRLKPTWRNIKEVRAEIWGQRSKARELRGSLREKQDKKAVADDRYIQFVRLRGHGIRFSEGSHLDEQSEIQILFNSCVAAREEYGPLEDRLNMLESNLSINEFELDRLETTFYDQSQRPRPPPEMTFEIKSSSSSSSSSTTSESESEEGQAFIPLVADYLSKLGDMDILQERLDELLEERENLEEEREKRARVAELLEERDDQEAEGKKGARMKLRLSDEDEDWLARYSVVETGMIEEYETAKREMEILRKRCVEQNLVDEITGDPIDFEHRERRAFAEELKDNGESVASEYVRFPKLIPQPGIKLVNSIPESLIKEDAEPTIASSVRVNSWILDQLRTSAMEVGLLARTFESKHGAIKKSDKWQSDVLKLWYRDGAEEAWLKQHTSSLRRSATTQDA